MARDDTREAPPGLVIRPLTEADLDAADRVNRLAFGTFFGLDDPMTFRGDSGLIHCRFRADPEGGLAAELDGRLVASAQVMNWGSVGIISPVNVDVAFWRRGIAHALMPPVMDILNRRGHRFTGLFTHPQSPLHVRLYEELGYSMQHMTGVMGKDVAAAPMPGGTALFSMLTGAEQAAALEERRRVTDTIFPALDLGREIRSVADQGLGETLLLARDGRIVGFAVCHHGAMSEGGSAQLLIKFAAVACGESAPDDFDRLVSACGALAFSRGAPRIVAGTNTARHEAYGYLRRAGFRTFMNGIAMIRPHGPGYNQPGVYVIDDWR